MSNFSLICLTIIFPTFFFLSWICRTLEY